jgi:hypothetical protein
MGHHVFMGICVMSDKVQQYRGGEEQRHRPALVVGASFSPATAKGHNVVEAEEIQWLERKGILRGWLNLF